MSATTVLVPLSEPEGEALLAGGDARREVLDEIRSRALLLRARVARIDAIREDLHALLFPKWEAAARGPSSFFSTIAGLLRPKQPPRAARGYDPFVHLFGRSLPVTGADPRAESKRLSELERLAGPAYDTALATDLRSLDPRAAELFLATSEPAPAADLDTVIAREVSLLDTALAATPPDPRQALDAVVRLSAWSRPVWRFDGEMLPSLIQSLGIGVDAGSAAPLFEELAADRPEVAPTLVSLPKALPDFAGPGSFLTSTDVRMLAGALRLQRAVVLHNALSSGEAREIVLRHARLLEEAVFYCEEGSLALAEASGVEWHDRNVGR